jgi:hypothetical protein
MFFDEVGVVELLEQHQTAPTSSVENKIVKHLTPLVYSLIPISSSHAEYDDLVQEGLIKVVALIPKWSRSRGKAYSFFSTSIKNRLNTLLSGKTFNSKVDLVPVETLDMFVHTEVDILIDHQRAVPYLMKRIQWRLTEPSFYKACNWYVECLAGGISGRERIIKTMCAMFDISPADAEYIIGLVTVTLRQRLVDNGY